MTWYNPQELKDQADGDQVQPEFDPPATPDIDLVEGGMSDELRALIDRANEIKAITDTLPKGDS